jgi:hypothetical protein
MIYLYFLKIIKFQSLGICTSFKIDPIYIFVVIDTGVWTQGFMLAMQVLYHLSDSVSPVLFFI